MSPTALTSATGALALLVAGLAQPHPVRAQQWTANEAAAEALANHPAIQQAGAALRGAAAGADAARSSYLPQVQFGASAVRFEEPMVVAPLHAFNPMAPPTFSDGLVRSRIGLGFTLFDGGVRGGALSAARALDTGAEAGKAAVEAQIIAATVEAYARAATAALVVEASQRRRRALVAEVSRADQSFEAGASPRVETLRAGAALAQADADQASAEASLASARRILQRLTGRGTLPSVLPVPGVVLADPDRPVDSDAPALRGAQAALSAAEARHRAARGAFLPRIEVASGVDQYGALDESFSYEWQAGLQVSLPIFMGGRRFAETRQRAAEVDEARAGLARVRLEAENGLDQARAALTAARGRVAALTSAEAQFTEVVRVEALALSEGSGIQSDLLSAEASLFGVRAELARARGDVVTAAVAIARANGTLSLDWLGDHLETSR
ncbi:MAG: TolC family protein [Gemmatimonadota bacterium]|nr:TolC family protein [Gemmatimonadota bacterium]